MAAKERTRQLETEIARLSDLNRAALIELWVNGYGRPSPKGASRKLLVRSAAYNLQAKVQGGLKHGLHCKLMQIACDTKPIKSVTDRKLQLKPGVRLIREWHGTTHTVEVVEDGFHWNGETYQSLSAIAKSITGARWSGPRFFQL